MAIAACTRLGPYEGTAQIGAGTGEEYRSLETKLNRDIALKILPEAFATDEDRLAQFRRRSIGARLAQPSAYRRDLRVREQRQHALVPELVKEFDAILCASQRLSF